MPKTETIKISWLFKLYANSENNKVLNKWAKDVKEITEINTNGISTSE